MKNIILTCIALSAAMLTFAGAGLAASAFQVISYDIGADPANATLAYAQYAPDKNFTMSNFTDLSILPYTNVAHAIKITPPRAGWTLRAVQIMGYEYPDNKNKTYPVDAPVILEIRDADLNLLHQANLIQNDYFNLPVPLLAKIDVPSITMKGDFYICFYERGEVGIGMNMTGSGDRSFFYDRISGELEAAGLTTSNNKTIPVNWIMRAVGS
jgi:hypothetical protein